MSELHVTLLGPIGLHRDGTELALPGRRTRAVLAILALSAGRTVSVDQLLDSLWGETVTAGAPNTLQSYVSAIRNAAEDTGIVQRRGPGYVLGVEPDQVDALRFERLVADARAAAEDPRLAARLLRSALDMWQGRALADVEAEPFAMAPVTRLDELRAEALERFFDAELLLGGHARVIGRLEETVREFPLRERFAAQLALAQYRAGRQAEALATIDRVRTQLLEDLGLSLSEELGALEHRVLNQDPSLAPPAEPAPSAGAGELPRAAATSLTHALAGRREELDALLRWWSDAQQGSPSAVVLNGESGVGKTRLIAELAASVHQRGRRVVWCRCSEGARLPYEPFVEAVNAVRAPGGTGGFSDLLPSEKTTDAGIALLALHEAVATVLADALAGGGILVVDDLQWADAKTAGMLNHVVVALASLPVLVVIGRRTGVPNPDLDRAVGELRRVCQLHRIDLDGLDPEAVRALVTEAHGPDDDLAARLHERTSGNPFFVLELLAADDDSVPLSVTEAVAARVGPADRPLGRLLGAAAVLDRDADLDLLAAIARLDEEDALDALDTALAGDLLRESKDSGEELSFSHAIVRDAAYRGMTRARRQRLHRLAAAALAARHAPARPGAHQVEIARHLLEAGSAASVGELAIAATAASDWCLQVLAYDDAIDIAQRALDRADEGGAVDADDRRTRARLRLHLALALNATGSPQAARSHLRVVLQTADQLGDPSLTASAALAMAGGPGAGVGVRWGVVDDELVEVLGTALDTVPTAHQRPRARLLAALARALYNDPEASGRSEEASAAALELAEGVDDEELLADTLIARCIALWRPTRLADRLGLARRAVELAATRGDDAGAVAAYLRLLPDAFEAGELAVVRSALAALDEKTARLRQPRFRWFVPLAASALALTHGDIERAQTEADAALQVAGDAQADGPALSHLVGTTMIARDRGQMAAQEAALRRRIEADPWNMTPQVLLALLLAETDRPDEAAGQVAAVLASLPRDYLWLGHLGLVAEAVVRIGDTERAAALHTELTVARGRMLMLGATAPVGAADRALGLLSTIAGPLERALAELTQGRDLHTRLGARYLQARSEADLARLHHLLGDEESAATAAACARRIAGELGLPEPRSPISDPITTS